MAQPRPVRLDGEQSPVSCFGNIDKLSEVLEAAEHTQIGTQYASDQITTAWKWADGGVI